MNNYTDIYLAVDKNGDFVLFKGSCPERISLPIYKNIDLGEDDPYGHPMTEDRFTGKYNEFWGYVYKREQYQCGWVVKDYEKGVVVNPLALDKSLRKMTWKDEPINLSCYKNNNSDNHNKDTINKNIILSEDDIWKKIERLNWQNLIKEDNYNERLSCFLYYNYRKDDIKTMYDFIKDKYKLLINLYNYNKNVNLKLSDDGLWDLCAHIVGCGKKAFYDVISNPNKAKEYLTSYKENFIYGFSQTLKKFDKKW